MDLVFWWSVGVILYVYAGYPLLLALVARLRRRRVLAGDVDYAPTVTLFISAYNEDRVIRAKLDNALELDYPRERLEIIVISDASSDRTDDIVREFADRGVRLLRMPERAGKTLGLNAAVAATHGELLVFSDANAMYGRNVLRALAARFADTSVGAVTGESRYRRFGGGAAAESEGVYWRYEQLVKRLESAAGSLIGGDGAIYAVRRSLYRPMRASDLSDFVNPMQVVGLGYRNVYEPSAVCYEDAGDTFQKEYRRKVRIVNRGWRATMRLAGLLNPFRHGFVSLQLFSHKVLRWLAGLFLAAIFLSSALLSDNGTIYWVALAAQIVFYSAAFAGAICASVGHTPRLLAVPYFFCMVNAASLQGIAEYYVGRNYTTWSTVRQA